MKTSKAFYYKSIGSRIFDVSNILFMLILSAIFILPLLSILALSLSDGNMLGMQSIGIIPKGFTLVAYEEVLKSANIFRHYSNTIYYACTGTVILLLLTSMLAYPLMFKNFSGGKIITILLLISMFFSGGLIPYYLIVVALGLKNTVWAMILPNAIAAWNVVIFRTFFKSIPISLVESAAIDGASHYRILAQIILPLSKPLLATFTLFTVVYFWNDYFQAILFLWDAKMRPIQLLLRELVVEQYEILHMNLTMNKSDLAKKMLPRTMRSAVIIITIVPILCVYPFLQKYFAKGIMVGSIKG